MNDAGNIIGLVSIGFNIFVFVLQSSIKSQLSELKAHMYENFATKYDIRQLKHHE